MSFLTWVGGLIAWGINTIGIYLNQPTETKNKNPDVDDYPRRNLFSRNKDYDKNEVEKTAREVYDLTLLGFLGALLDKTYHAFCTATCVAMFASGETIYGGFKMGVPFLAASFILFVIGELGDGGLLPPSQPWWREASIGSICWLSLLALLNSKQIVSSLYF